MFTVLVVDESKCERTRIVNALASSSGIVVVGAVSRLHTALHAIAEKPPDVIVSDVVLGDDHVRHLIAAARRSVLPPAIVVFASVDTIEERRRCIEAGAQHFVAKAAGLGALERSVTDAHANRAYSSVGERFALVGRLAAGVAHDLNNYLGVIDVSLALMKKRVDGEVANEISSLRNVVDTTIRLTSSLTRYARGSSPPSGEVDLGVVIRRVLEQFRTVFAQHAVTLDIGAVPLIDGIEIELEQLVLNLLLNACEADEKVKVHLHAVPGIVRLEITDGGPGMRDVGDAVTPSTKRDGTGLGLGIVRKVAQRHAAMLRIGGNRVSVDFSVPL